MTVIQRIFIRSIKVVFSVSDGNPTVVAMIPIYGTRVTAGKILMNDFLVADGLVIIDSTGIAMDKEVAREEFTLELEMGYGALVSLADETHDNELKTFANYTESDFNAMPGEQLVEVGKNLELKLATILPASILTTHGFSPTDATDLHTKLLTFEASLHTPEVNIKNHKELVKDRDAKYKKLHDFVTGPLDSGAKMFKKKAPAFFSLYKICRKLHLQGHRSLMDGGDVNSVKVIGAGKIVLMDVIVEANKVYMCNNVGQTELKWWSQATRDIPTSIPADAKTFSAVSETTLNSAEIGFPDKMYFFIGNPSEEKDGEIAIDEAV